MSQRKQQLQQLLEEITEQLKISNLWSAETPSPEALASTEPFCVDTLMLSEWLQWILLPRMKELLDRDLPLPGNCNIHAIAEESFKNLEQDCSKLLTLIQSLDNCLTIRH